MQDSRKLTKYHNGFPVAFMHIPKTAGSSITLGLREGLQPRRAAHGLGPYLFGKFDAYETIPEETRRGVFPNPESLPADVELVGGHISYSTLRARYPQAQLVTF